MSWWSHNLNHDQTSYRKLYFTEFVQNSLGFNTGIYFFTSDLMEAARDQKHSSDAENGMKESIYWKKFLMKVAQQPQKPHRGSNQIWDTTSE